MRVKLESSLFKSISVYTIPVMSVHAEDKDVEVCLKEKEISYLESSLLKSILYHTRDECPY